MVEVCCQPSLSALSNRSSYFSKIEQGSLNNSPIGKKRQFSINPQMIVDHVSQESKQNNQFIKTPDHRSISRFNQKFSFSRERNSASQNKFYNTFMNQNLYQNNGNVMMTVRVRKQSEEVGGDDECFNDNLNRDLNPHENYMLGQAYQRRSLPHTKLKLEFTKVNQKKNNDQIRNMNFKFTPIYEQNNFQTQRNLKIPKILIDREKIVTHRKILNKYSSLKELELKYIDILVPEIKDKQSLRKVKLNTDSMNDIQSKFCQQSLRDIRRNLNDSFKVKQRDLRMDKTSELKKIKEIINLERIKGQGKLVNWNQSEVLKHLRYPDNIIHKKQQLPSLIVSQKNFKMLKQNLSHENLLSSQLNITARQFTSQLKNQDPQPEQDVNFQNFRVRFIQEQQEHLPIEFNQTVNLKPAILLPIKYSNQTPDSIMLHQQQQQIQQITLKESENDKLDENMRKGENLPEKRYFINQKKASYATQNQIKLYLSQKRKESQYFQKPNLFIDWQNKQVEKRQFTISKIDNRRNSNQCQSQVQQIQ